MLQVALQIVFWSSCLAVAGCYVGYPCAVVLLASLRRKRSVSPLGSLPAISFVISAYNEVDVIRDKIENTLALDYPREQLEILVISDASDDGTDEVVSSYRERGVMLCRQEQRAGKSAGLRRFVPDARGEIVVFSDANSIYQTDAVRRLVEPFADEQVGYVVGHQRYAAAPGSSVADSESEYWKYESFLKHSESRLSSVVGGDGAIFAIRRRLFQPLRDDDLSDFVTPLQIVVRGYRGVYEPGAICYEATAESFAGEFRRKVRIVNRGMRGLFRVPRALNPWVTGWFAFQLTLHKLLRWLVPYFLVLAFCTSGLLAWSTPQSIYGLALVCQLATYSAAALGTLPLLRRVKLFYLCYYFCLVNVAAALGTISYCAGRSISTWTPERGQVEASSLPQATGLQLLWLTSCALLLVGAGLLVAWQPYFAFWGSAAALFYVHAGYFLILAVSPRQSGAQVTDLGDWPMVSLIIPAYNEARVLQEKIQNALSLDYPAERLEIIVGSDGSDDATVEIASGFADAGVKVKAFDARRGKASVLNDCVAESSGTVVCLCDANVIFKPQALQHLVRRLADEQVGAVTGLVRLRSQESTFEHGERLYYRIEQFIQTRESAAGSLIGVDGGMYVVRRELFRPLAPDTILDDFVVSMRVIQQGKRVVYEPLAIADEGGTPTARQEFWRRVRLAAGAIQAVQRGHFPRWWQPLELWQFLSHKLLRWLGPFFLVALLASSMILSSAGKFYAAAFSIQLLVYSLGIVASVSQLLRSTRIGGIAFYFVLSHLAMFVGYLRGALNIQRVTWPRTERA